VDGRADGDVSVKRRKPRSCGALLLLSRAGGNAPDSVSLVY
jgi:hypothetical protein